MNIGDRSKSVTVASLCRALKMSRQNWYKGRVLRRRRQVDENLVVHLVKGERKLQNRLGTRKPLNILEPEFARNNVQIGRDGPRRPAGCWRHYGQDSG